ncbi:MAG: phage holin family protein [Bdellovibrionales bacterium]|nr:phage holin family protein [Massilia sp.]
MAILDSVSRIGATFVEMVGTRLALAAVEMEEESQRVLGYFVQAFLALIMFGIAMVMVCFAIILIFWETYRLHASVALALLFAVGGLIVAMRLKAAVSVRPRLMATTVAELNKDFNHIRNAEAVHEQ